MTTARTARWQDDAACTTTDPDLWFADRAEGVRAALDICGRCPVAAACLTDALETNDWWGIRGAMTPKMRWQLRFPHRRFDAAAQLAGRPGRHQSRAA